jgi:hypothetical protein
MNGPPIKSEAPQQTGRRETNCARRGYAPCEHNATRVLLFPHGSVHHGKEACTDCDAFLRWVPKPKTIATSYPLKTAGSSTAPSNSKRICSKVEPTTTTTK